MNYCFVQLGRAGDIMNLLPLCKQLVYQGNKIYLVVHTSFGELLEGVSYVEPVQVEYSPNELYEASCYAHRNFKNIIISQVHQNTLLNKLPKVNFENVKESYCLKQWRLVDLQLGTKFTESYYNLPLNFDLRHPLREEQLAKHYPVAKVLVNLEGTSSPFSGRKDLGNKIGREINDFRVLFLPKVHRIYDLLGLYERASLLVTTDTATLHLANDVSVRDKLGVLALVNDDGKMSPTAFRQFWKLRMPYSNWHWPAIKNLILEALGKEKGV